jgi:hypothetical protein
MLMPASRKKRQDWNVVNNYSTQSTINILTKEKKLCEQKTKTITVLGTSSNRNKWNETIRKQKGVKLGFGPTKKWDLKVNKEIDLEFEQESDDVIINDDYNNVKGPEMRPVTATIIKVKEEEDTSSVSSYDVFQNVIIKRTGYEFGLGGTALKKGGLEGYGAYQLGLGSGGIGGIGLLKDRKDLEFGMNGMGVGKRTLEFGMSGIGGVILPDLRNYKAPENINPVDDEFLNITIYPGKELEEIKNTTLYPNRKTVQIVTFTSINAGAFDEIILKKIDNPKYQKSVSKTNGDNNFYLSIGFLNFCTILNISLDFIYIISI